MKKLALAASVVALLAPATAQAADWTGWYGGAELGYGDVSTTPNIGSGSGAIGGITGGYDFDFGMWVLGAGLDYDWASIDLGGGVKLKDVFRAKLRLGYEINLAASSGLLYATGGYARANVDPIGRDDGYYYGAGYEYLIPSSNWSIAGEVLQHKFKDFKSTGVDAEATTAQVRLMLRF